MEYEQLKYEFINLFREMNFRAGENLPYAVYQTRILDKLNEEEKKQMRQIIEEMIKDGKVAEEEGYFMLLDKGYESFYECKSLESLEEDVFSYIKDQKGFVYERNLKRVLRDKWNPKEQQFYGVIIDRLIEMGKIKEKEMFKKIVFLLVE